MTIVSSGNIKLSDLAAEWSDTQPYKLSEFYNGGSLVNNNAIPSTGHITLSDFYGTSAITTTLLASLAAVPTNTQFIFSGNKTSSVSASDVLSKQDGSNEVTVSAVTWPDNVSTAGSAASDNHGSGTVRRLGGDYRSTFSANRLISNSAGFGTYGTISSSSYSSFSTSSTSWTTQSGNGTAYVYGYVRGQAGYNGLYVSGGIPGFSTGTWAPNNSGTGSISLPYAVQNRYYPTTNTFTNLAYNTSYGGSLATNQLQVGGNHSTLAGKMVALSANASGSNLWGYCTSAVYNSGTNGTVLTFDSTGYPIYLGQQFGSGQNLHYATAVAVKFYRMSTYGAGGFGTGITTSEHIRANRTFYKSTTTTTTTYYTQVNYSGGGDLFSSGSAIYVGDNQTDVTINSGGTNFTNGENVYIKT